MTEGSRPGACLDFCLPTLLRSIPLEPIGKRRRGSARTIAAETRAAADPTGGERRIVRAVPPLVRRPRLEAVCVSDGGLAGAGCRQQWRAPCPHGHREDARRFARGHREERGTGRRRCGGRPPGGLDHTAAGPRCRHRAGDRRTAPNAAVSGRGLERGRPHRRHLHGRPAAAPRELACHSGHHARVALDSALARRCSRDFFLTRDRDRG